METWLLRTTLVFCLKLISSDLVETYLWSFWVCVEFLHQVHATLGVDGPVDNAVPEAQLSQVNCYNVEHAGPLGHDHAAQQVTGQFIPFQTL